MIFLTKQLIHDKILRVQKFIYILLLAASLFPASTLGQETYFSNALPEQALREINNRDFLNDLLAKDRYLALAYENIKIIALDFNSNPPTIERLRSIYIDGFGHLENGEQGAYHNFKTKDEFDRFYQFARYQSVRNELRSYRKSLLSAAPPAIVQKAIRLELKSAMERYERGDYPTARLYLEDIYETYSPMIRTMDDVLYFQAESNFGMKYFIEARKLYEKMLVGFPTSPYASKAVFRILFMDYVYEDARQFQKDFRRLTPFLKMEDEFDFKTYILAGIIDYRNQQYGRAVDALSQVPDRAELKILADYAAGLAFLGLQQNNEAEDKFKRVASRLFIPWDERFADIRNSSYIQLAHLAYIRGNKFLEQAKKLYYGTESERHMADSSLYSELARQATGKQVSVYERQLMEVLRKIEMQDTSIQNMAQSLESEIAAISMSEQELMRFNEMLQQREKEINSAEAGLEKIREDLIAAQEEGKLASERIERMRERLARAQREVLFARFDVYRKLALSEFANAELYFDRVARGHKDKDLAELGRLWVLYRSGRYREAKTEIETYFRKYRQSDNLYQAMFLSGYITHSRYMQDPTRALNDYNFVYNGYTAFQYAEKYLAQKDVLRQQRINVQGVMVSSSATADEVSSATALKELIGSAMELLVVDRKAIVDSDKGLLSPERKASLQVIAEKLGTLKQSLSAKGLTALANSAELSQKAVEQLVSIASQSINDDARLFMTHAPVLISGELSDYNRNLQQYKKIVAEEIARSEEQVSRLESAVPTEPKQDLLRAYYLNTARMVRDQNSALQTLLQQKEFYGTETIERSGTVAQYAFSGLMYDEVKKRRDQVKNYERVVSIFKTAVKKKITQLENYLEQINKESIYDGGPIITKADLLQKEFDEVYKDFRRAFFIGYDYLKLSNVSEQRKVQMP